MASARALLDSLSSGQAQPRSARALLASLQQPRPAAPDSGWASQRSVLPTVDPRQLTDMPVNVPQTTAVDQTIDPRPKYATLNPQDNAGRIGERQFSAAENLAAIPAGLAAGAIYGANEPGTSSLAGQILTPHLQAPTATPSRFVGQFAPYVAGSAALTRAIPALASQAITGATTGARLGQAAANLGRGVAVDAATSVGVEGLRQTAAGEFDPQELALQGLLYPALGVGLNVPGQVKGVRRAAENVPPSGFNLGDDPAATLRPPVDIPPVAAPTDDLAAATKHVDNVIQNNMTPTQRVSMTPEARQRMIDQKVAAIERGRSMRAFESTPEGKAKAEQDRLAGIEREKQKTIQAGKDEVAQTEWKSKGNTKRQLSAIEKKLQSSGVEFQTNWNADKNSAYVKFVSPIDGETYTVRVSDHKQPEFGGFRQNDEGTGSRGFESDLSIDPISGKTVAEIDGLLTPTERMDLPPANQIDKQAVAPQVEPVAQAKAPDQSVDVGEMVEKQPWEMTRAEQYAVEKGIHPKTITTLNDAMSSSDIVFQSEKLQSILHPGNKLSRGIFEERTGTKLPKTVKGTNEAIGEWQLKNNPEVLKKVREKIASQYPDKLADFDSNYPDLTPPVAKNATADVAPKVDAPTVGESAFSKVQHAEIPKSFQVEIDVPSAKTGKIRKVKANAREAYENAGKMADQHKALLACLRGK